MKRLCLLLVSLCSCGRSVPTPEDPVKAHLDRYPSARVEMGQWSGGDGRAIFTLGEDGRAATLNLRVNGADQIARRL